MVAAVTFPGTDNHTEKEKQLFTPVPQDRHGVHLAGMAAYERLCAEAARDYTGFWARLARENLVWETPFTSVLDEGNPPFYRWFDGGLLNASITCLDRHTGTETADKVAIRFEADDGKLQEITYYQLLERVCIFANALRRLGIGKGDRVVIYLPMSIEAVIAMQACARIGAVHNVVFGGFSARALHERIIDAGAVLVITANMQRRGGRELPLKILVDEALCMEGADHVRHVLVYERTATPWPRVDGRDLSFAEAEKGCSTICPAEMVEAEHPLFILYTSGSTGRPKGVVHSTAGFLLWARQTMMWSFDCQDDDIFWCTADIGWITGHSYVAYGPLAAGVTQIIFEGIPSWPDYGRFWRMIEQHRVTVFYTAPTIVRVLAKAAACDPDVQPGRYDLSSLRVLATVGEPIAPKTWLWFYEQVGQGRCPVIDTFFQTETGGHLIAPLPGVTPLEPGSCGLPLPGMMVSVVDETGRDVPHGESGFLVVRRPFPSMMCILWNDPERFRREYFPAELGHDAYMAGDGAMRGKATGYFRITGRMDDVLNVSGHRLGTMEIESALLAKSDLVAEAAVVGCPDEITGEAVCAFIVLKIPVPEGDYADEIARELRQWVGTEISPIARPKEVRFGEQLPRTRSGKIMRRLLRAIARGEALAQDLTTLENPEIIQHFMDKAL